MIDGLDEIKHKFIPRRGFFNQVYLSIRFPTHEIAIDNLLPSNKYQLSICTPYNERLDKLKHKRGIGAGEVKRCWYFDSEDEVYRFVLESAML